MRITTILNQTLKFKSFTCKKAILTNNSIHVEIAAKKNCKAICSICGTPSPGYDTLKKRLFEFIPMWGFKVFFEYAMRRVSCPKCQQIVVEKVPWSDGKNQSTHYHLAFLAHWAKHLSWKTVATIFGVDWHRVFAGVERAVTYGLANRSLVDVNAIGIDEIAWKKGHNYITVIYQLDQGSRRLLGVVEKRTKKSLDSFFREMNKAKKGFSKNLKVVCTDMWKPFINSIKEKAKNAINVIDHFHVKQKMNKALDKVRASEVKRLKKEKKDPVLAKSRWCFLKRRGNLTRKQGVKLRELLKMNLTTVKAYLLIEQFEQFWEYKSPTWAGKFLESWCDEVLKSNILDLEPVVNMLKSHKDLLLNYFRANKKYNSGIVEGLNRNINLSIRKAYGFRTFNVAKTCLFHQYGQLPEEIFTHRFW